MFKEKYLDLSIKQAKIAYIKDEVPVGCVIVKDDVVLAKAYNQKVKKNDSTSHAEIECIKKATRKLNTWHLDGCDMYVTLEPCMMCTGAIVNSRIKNVYFGAKDLKGGCLVSNIKIDEVKNINHYPKVHYIENKECENLLKDFFKNKRNIAKAIL